MPWNVDSNVSNPIFNSNFNFERISRSTRNGRLLFFGHGRVKLTPEIIRLQKYQTFKNSKINFLNPLDVDKSKIFVTVVNAKIFLI